MSSTPRKTTPAQIAAPIDLSEPASGTFVEATREESATWRLIEDLHRTHDAEVDAKMRARMT